jgi:hypothetical protein
VSPIVLDEAGVLELLAVLRAKLTGPALQHHPQPMWDIEDLHEADLDAELWSRLPETPSGTVHA